MGNQAEWWQFSDQIVALIYRNLFQSEHADFKFVTGRQLFSTNIEVAASLVLYLVIIFGLREFMKSRPEMPLKSLFAVHNLLLTLASLALLLLLLENLVPKILQHGLHWAVCSEEMFQDGRLEFFYYLNYLTKFWELVDTIFLVLQKKPLKFLHVYHHSLTMLLCYTQLRGTTTVQWVPILLNVFVHVVMYYYYFLCAIEVKNIWWKQYVTTIQIVQFVLDLIACYFAMYSSYAFEYKWPNFGDCYGDRNAGWYGCLLLTSYLYLFIDFFNRTYFSKSKKEKKAH